MIIELTKGLEEKLKDEFNSDLELSIWLLAKVKEERLIIEQAELTKDRPNNASATTVPENYLKLVKESSENYELLTGHMHSRTYGKKIEIFDPYWTISQDNYTPGQIIEEKFYVTRKEKSKGDTEGIIARELYGKAIGIRLNKTLFIHAAYRSEGDIMTRELVKISAYEIDLSNNHKLKELKVIII